jgi:riboflavin kinase/FMN adenylyltransferase
MLVHSGNIDLNLKNAVVTIGTFDGVHLGHMAVISHLKRRAKELKGESVVITFFPHPRKLLSGNNLPLSLLSSPDEKRDLLDKTGIDHLIILDFDRELSMMEAYDFIEKILIRKIRTKHLIVGYNHHFGRRGEGDFKTIKSCAERFGVTVEMVDAIGSPSGTISSSIIRDALFEGRIEKANRMLGYGYQVKGTIVEGKKLGRKLGFPTANLVPEEPDKLIPANGVYAVEVFVEDERYKGVMSIGLNPTVNKNPELRSLEVNIFDFDRDIYGAEITIIFRFRLRSEMVFGSLSDLAAQIELDKKKAIELLG